MEILIFKNAFMIDGVSDKATQNGLLVVQDDKIAYAGPHNEDVIAKYISAEGALVHELNGKTLMPGLIDAHIHFSSNGAPAKFEEQLFARHGFLAIRGALNAKKMLDAGFTTVRSVGERFSIDYDIRKIINDGIMPGPRVVTSGRALTVTSGHGDLYPDGMNVDGLSEICDTADDVVKAVRNRIKNGADCIKFMATGGGGTPGPATATKMSMELMAAGVEEAAGRGLITAAHAIGAEGILFSIKAGVRTIEHGVYLDDEGIEEMVKRGNCWLVPTLAAYKTIKYGDSGGVSPEQIKKVTEFSNQIGGTLAKAKKAGIKFAAGTDCGTPFNYPGENAYELNRFVHWGFSEMEAIQIATSGNALAINQCDIGSLQEGKTADLLIVEGNPLKDIGVLEDADNIKAVYRYGKLMVSRQ